MIERCRIGDIAALPDSALPVVRVVVAHVEGSTPREAGAAMLVMRDGVRGTIGGGQLEFEAIAHARGLLNDGAASPKHRDGNSLMPGSLGHPPLAGALSRLGERADPAAMWRRDLRTWPLGPSLGQCCGGAVRVLFEYYGAGERRFLNENANAASLLLHPAESAEPIRFLKTRHEARDLPVHTARAASDMLSGARRPAPVLLSARKGGGPWFIEPAAEAPKPLFLYGAGHVGRAIVKALADLDFTVSWVDVSAVRFPTVLPDGVVPIVAQDPAAIVQGAPAGAYHLVLTFSHALDLAICHALLANPAFGFLGLIGSESKRARFIKRLREGGIPPAALARLTCPIGIGRLRGKEPATIAISVAAQLIEQLEHERGLTAHEKEGKLEKSGRLSA
jgi:xanthine dehydrogenase accessory factor